MPSAKGIATYNSKTRSGMWNYLSFFSLLFSNVLPISNMYTLANKSFALCRYCFFSMFATGLFDRPHDSPTPKHNVKLHMNKIEIT